MATTPEDHIQALGALIDMTYALIAHMRHCNSQGGFTYDDLAIFLVEKYQLSLPMARERVTEVISHLNRLMEYDGTVYQMVDPRPSTSDDTVTAWKVMAATLRPQPQRSQPGLLGSRTALIDKAQFERFRPKRSAARWLTGAPEAIIACYDNGGRTAARYTVLFGGLLWDTERARENWRAGLDPRLTRCLSMSDNPSQRGGISDWRQCLYGRHMGRKIRWLDLPENIRNHVVLHGLAGHGESTQF